MRPIVHVEIASADNDAQKAFYSALLGWEINDVPMGPDYTYTMFRYRRRYGRGAVGGGRRHGAG